MSDHINSYEKEIQTTVVASDLDKRILELIFCVQKHLFTENPASPK